MKRKILVTVILMAVYPFGLSYAQETGKENPRDWLINEKDERERLILLQNYLRGFSVTMWEVGERYKHIYSSLQDENYDLAIYHWKEIGKSIKSGYMKRPGRQANSDAMFMNSLYGDVLESFESRDIKKAWKGFSAGRNACMACHNAENIPWMNNQPLFRDTTPPQ